MEDVFPHHLVTVADSLRFGLDLHMVVVRFEALATVGTV
jgi:hypothetical protein